jgi:hypothetical protein
MVSNAVTKPLSLFVFFLLSVSAQAAPSVACVEKWAGSDFGRRVLEQKKNDATLDSFLSKASGDFLASAALDLEQKVLSQCSDTGLKKLLQKLQSAYLARLGVKPTSADTATYFKAFLVPESESASLREAIRKVPINLKKPALENLRKVYGKAAWVDGVLVVGATPREENVLRSYARRGCGSLSPCPLWDPAFLARVAVLPGKGQAAYTKEIASLRVSQDLLEDGSPLNKVVVLHELAHSAQWRAFQQTGADWREEFQTFSAWEKTANGWKAPTLDSSEKWNDEFTKASKNSAFSLLPDDVLLDHKRSSGAVDGFVFARAERETKKASDTGEDLADHIAAFVAAPSRFCFGTKPIAARKYE